MIILGLCVIWFALDIVVIMAISLEIKNTVTDCDKGYIELCCFVKSESVSKIHSIKLKRFDGDNEYVVKEINMFDAEQKKVVETQLASRHGVTVNSSISNVGFSYMSIRIMSSVVNPQMDKGQYQCFLLGLNTYGGSFEKRSTPEILNITDTKCSDQTTIEIQNTKITSTTLYEKNQSNLDDSNRGTYREFTVVTGVVICCILLLIMMREIRLYYCTSENIVYV